MHRSTDGKKFASILSQVPGNNGGAVTYRALDRRVVAGDLFYRIKANSLSGQVQYSAIVKVAGSKTSPTITVYPNPVTGKQMQVRFNAAAPGAYQLHLVNAAGQVIYKSSENVTGGSLSKTIRLGSDVAAGRYDLIVIAPDGSKAYLAVFIQ